MEFKGTKGKWEAIENSYYFDVRTSNKNGRDLCVNVLVLDNCKTDSLSEENKANAKLIAAAPEMFEMLKVAKSTIQSLRLSMSAHPDYEVDSEFYDYVDLADEKETEIEKLLTKITQ